MSARARAAAAAALAVAASAALALCAAGARAGEAPRASGEGKGGSGLAARLDAIFDAPELRHAEIGVAVLDLATGAALYERDAGRPLVLASNQKLVTTAAALARLGPEYRFETALARAGAVEGGMLRGDLIVRGGGDPCMGARFDGEADGTPRRFARAVRAAGILRVAGDIVADDRFFDRELRHPEWPRDQLDRWYAAPVAALSLNDGCLDVAVAPGARPGLPVVVNVAPAGAPFELDVRATTTASRREHRISVERRPGTDRIVVRGAALVGAAPVEASIAVEDPALFFAEVLRACLVEEGVAVEGRARLAGPDDPRAPAVIATHASTLARALPVVNRRSQNHYAEMIFKTLGAVATGRPGSFAGGAEAVARFLDEAGIPRDSYAVADGSGLARGNRMAPRDLARLLAFMARHPHADTYVRSLAPAGDEETTLGRRLRSPLARGRVYAKTGTIRGVSALSGYVLRAPEAREGVAFAILVNGLEGGSAPARAAQDACVEAILGAAAPASTGRRGKHERARAVTRRSILGVSRRKRALRTARAGTPVPGAGRGLRTKSARQGPVGSTS